MGLRDSIKSDVSSVFLQTSEFAEDVRYSLRAGGSRPIKAIVDREPAAFMDARGNSVTPKYILTIRNDCQTGMQPSEIDTGGDVVRLKKDLGGTVDEDVTVLVVLSQDMGMVELALA